MAAFFIGGLPSWALAETENQPIISKIKIRSTNIFDFETKPYLEKIPYTWINALHIQTKEKVIRQEILLKEGSPWDLFLAQETERNLRALSFIRAARVTKFPQRDGTVVAVVYVSDSWTTEPKLNLSGNNRIDNLEVGFKEKNLFGYGKNIDIEYADNDSENRTTLRYRDPQLFSTKWQLTAEAVDKSRGQEKFVSLNRPFYSADSKYTMGFNHFTDKKDVDEFDKTVKVSEFKEIKEENEASIGFKLGGGREIVNRVGLRYKKELTHFNSTSRTNPTRPVPGSQEFQTFFLDWSLTRNNFVKLNRIEKMHRVEDFNLGPILGLSPGYQPESLTGTEEITRVETFYEHNYLFLGGHFFRGKWSYGGRDIFDSAENQKNLLTTKFYYKKFPNQTLTSHLRLEWGQDLDPDSQVEVGNQNGLRAYKETEVVGNKGIVFNLEDRIYFVDDLWSLFSLGSVVYFDSGYAWGQNQTVAPSDMLHAVGAGVRIGMTKSSNELILRLDVSYRLTTSALNDDRWVVSFGSGQSF